MPESSAGITPPYLSYVTFKNTVRGLLAAGHMPRQIDHSVLPGLSGSVRKSFMSALRFFDLIDDVGKPHERLDTLASADETTWQDCVGTMLKEKYGDLVELLADASPKQVREQFEACNAGIGNTVVAPAIRFLVTAADDAGLPVSPHLKQRKVPSVGGRKRTKKTPKHNPAITHPPPPDTRPQGSVLLALLDKFPAFDPSWGSEEQKAWFAAYEKLIDMQKQEPTHE